MSSTTTTNSTDASPQQIGKAFVVQYYRLLHEHPESLYRFYSTSSTLMHDDPTKTVSGIENICKRIEELSFKQRHVKIRQVDCHSTVGSSVVVQVCGEISAGPILDNNQTPIMKRFVQTFVLAPTTINDKQKYYVHNDIFRYQDNQTSTSTTDNTNTRPSSLNTSNEASFGTTPTRGATVQTPITPSSLINIEFSNDVETKQEEKSVINSTESSNEKPKTQEKEQSTKPKSYRDAIGKKEKVNTNESSAAPAATTTTAAAATGGTKNTKSGKQKSSKTANRNARSSRGHPQDANEYYDESYYYGTGEEEGYLATGYVDDQEVFVGDLSAQITEAQIHQLFQPYGRLLLVRIGNTGSQVGAANFAFVVCDSIDMAKAIVADHDKLLKAHQINVEAKKRRPFPHTFRPTYPTAASPNNYQSTGHPASFYEHSSSAPFYGEGVSDRGGGGGAKRGGRGGTH